MPGVKVTLSEDATPSQPTILITQGSDSSVAVNVLGVHPSQAPAVAQLLIDIGMGLAQLGEQEPTAAKDQHLDAENVPSGRPKFAPH